MKLYVFTYFLFVCFLGSCRSSSQSATDYLEDQETRTTNQVAQKDSTQTESQRTDSLLTITQDNSYARVTHYRPDGTISSIQEQWRDLGSTQLATSSGRSSSVSVNEKKKKEETSGFKHISKQEQKTLASDMRPIQGKEWIYVLGLIIIVCTIIYFIRKRKK